MNAIAQDLCPAGQLRCAAYDARVPAAVISELHVIFAGAAVCALAAALVGALLLGAYVDSKLRFVGKVGTGFDESTLASLASRFRPLIRKRSDFVNPPRERGVTFLAPRLVAQISYQELTTDSKLRQPVFLGLRDDKNAKEVRLPAPSK